MKRQRIISVTVLLVLLSATLPIGLSYYLAWRLALAREEGRLSQLAALSIRRTETAFDEAHGILLSMAASRLPPCSPAHLAQMRALVLTSHYIVELGRFQQGRLSCTSWGQLRNTIPQRTADFVVKRGISVTTRLLPLANPQRPLMALQLGEYNVLINPDTLADINIPPGLQLAIGTPDGQILSSTGTAAEHLLIDPTAKREPGDLMLSQVLFGRDRRGDWRGWESPCSAASSSCTTNRSLRSIAVPVSVPKRWCAGSSPTACWCHRTPSSPWPNKAA